MGSVPHHGLSLMQSKSEPHEWFLPLMHAIKADQNPMDSAPHKPGHPPLATPPHKAMSETDLATHHMACPSQNKQETRSHHHDI
jgi:hypothetical protein